MELTVFKRESNKKSEVKQLRWRGDIPGVLYAPGKESERIYISGAEFDKALRQIKKGRLATTIFTLKKGEKKVSAIVKDIQYHVTSYRVIHLDFLEISDDRDIKVHVPIECIGEEECAGIKLGATLRQVIFAVPVSCRPKDLPPAFVVDVAPMGMNESKHLGDLAIPAKVKLLANPKEVAAVIGAKR